MWVRILLDRFNSGVWLTLAPVMKRVGGIVVDPVCIGAK